MVGWAVPNLKTYRKPENLKTVVNASVPAGGRGKSQGTWFIVQVAGAGDEKQRASGREKKGKRP